LNEKSIKKFINNSLKLNRTLKENFFVEKSAPIYKIVLKSIFGGGTLFIYGPGD
jgi:hypothetical protein